MFLQVLILVVGFVFLIKGADIFIDGASSTARNFKVSKMLIGLTIVAFGTSAPEFAVSIKALISQNSDMVIGNVIGSNIMNILLILGVAAVIYPIKIKDNTVKKELPLCILLSLMLVVLFLDVGLDSAEINQITRSDGITLALAFLVFVYYTISLARKKTTEEEDDIPTFGMGKSLLFVLLGLLGIIFGSNLVVDSATKIAIDLGVSQRVISLSIVAFGTSLPELVTTIVSAKKKEQDLMVGNIIGSNIFNIGVVLGLPVAMFGKITAASFNYLDLIALVIAPIMLIIFSKTDKKITRKNGITMLITFFIYYALVFVI